ncbi:MAG: hypothetical protein HQL45_08665 [Alphaproteobacteria bacterium]|nr:hypothetical protein [Alphaproteobacteria bacterium]
MVTPVSVQEVVQLHNDLVDADEDIERIAALEWRAMKLVHQQPRSFSAHVCYGSILLSLAKRELATQELIAAYDLFDPRDTTAANGLAVSLAKAGFYDQSLTIYKKELALSRLANLEGVITNASMVAALSGEVDFLNELSQHANSGALIAKEYLRILELHGLLDHFKAHQQIVRAAILDRQCSGILRAFQEEDDAPILFCEYKILCDRQTRKNLDRQIFDQLENYYVSQDLPPGHYIGKVSTVLVPVSEYRQGEKAA